MVLAPLTVPPTGVLNPVRLTLLPCESLCSKSAALRVMATPFCTLVMITSWLASRLAW